jgi:hypothetical protein
VLPAGITEVCKVHAERLADLIHDRRSGGKTSSVRRRDADREGLQHGSRGSDRGGLI